MFWLILANRLSNYYSRFSWMVLFLKLNLWRRFLLYKLSIDLQKKFSETSLYVIEICELHQTKVNVKPEWIWFIKKCLLCLKRGFLLGVFLASFMNFCVMTAFEIFVRNFWMIAFRLFIVEPTFVSMIKIINSQEFLF